MNQKERDSSKDDFVDVNLQDSPPNEPISHRPSRPSLGSRLGSGWLSQLSLHALSPSNVSSQTLPLGEGLQHTFASTSTPDLHASSHPPPGTIHHHDIHRSQTVASGSMMSLTPSSIHRKVEGRYRSRLENPKSARLRPLILTKGSPSTPGAVQFDSQMKPGMSMTIQDANGELIVVRSPVPHEQADYIERVLTPLASKLLLQSAHTKNAQRSSPSLSDSPSMERTRKKHQAEKPLAMQESTSDADTSLTQEAQLNPLEISSPTHEVPTKSQENDPSEPKDATNTEPALVGLGLSGCADGKKTNLTRMLHLPPKPPQEEAKHLADFSAMMQASKEIQKIKKQSDEAEHQKRLEKEAQVRQVWDQEILPCWTRAREVPQYRHMWWEGIPQALRGRVWLRACGNHLMLSHNLYDQAVALVHQALTNEKIPSAWMEEIETDISQTLPSLRLFEEGIGPLYEDLKNVLLAFTFVRADEASQRERQESLDLPSLYEKYTVCVPGTANLAALLLLNMTPAQSLLSLMNLIASKPWLKAMYRLETRRASNDQSSELLGYDRVFNALLAERMPEIYANLHKMNIRPPEYLHDWIQSLFVPWLEVDTVSHLWDIIFLDEGETTLFRIAIALLELLEPRLYTRDREELLSILRGTNPAAIHIWHRESDLADDNTPPVDRIYAQYMLTEQSVFQCLSSQDAWWKDLTLQRLLDRELNR